MKLVGDLPSEAPFKATQRMGVPESVRLLRIAVPTPMQPITPLLPLSAIEPRPFPFQRTARSKLEEARNAALLFFVLVGGCALAACLVVAAIFP